MLFRSVEFNTVVMNNGVKTSASLIAAMNIINLNKTGESVDLAEWVPEQTQYIDALKPDESIKLDWIVTTGLQGDYMVYVVLIPQPKSASDDLSGCQLEPLPDGYALCPAQPRRCSSARTWRTTFSVSNHFCCISPSTPANRRGRSFMTCWNNHFYLYLMEASNETH